MLVAPFHLFEQLQRLGILLAGGQQVGLPQTDFFVAREKSFATIHHGFKPFEVGHLQVIVGYDLQLRHIEKSLVGLLMLESEYQLADIRVKVFKSIEVHEMSA